MNALEVKPVPLPHIIKIWKRAVGDVHSENYRASVSKQLRIACAQILIHYEQ